MTIIFSYTFGQWSVSHNALISSRFNFVNRVHAHVTFVMCYVSISCLHSEYLLKDVCVRCIYILYIYICVCVFEMLNHVCRYDATFVLTSLNFDHGISHENAKDKDEKCKLEQPGGRCLGTPTGQGRSRKDEQFGSRFTLKICMAQWLILGCFRPPEKF